MEFLLNYYNKGDEFEARCYFPDDIILKIYDSLGNKTGVLQSVISKQIAENAQARRVETYKMENTKLKRDILVYDIKTTKYTKLKRIGNHKIKFAVSSESKMDNMDLLSRESGLYCKLRWRESSVDGDWRFDFGVEIVLQNPEQLKQALLNKLLGFGGLRENHTGVATLSLEIEFIGENLTMDSILKLVLRLEELLQISGGGSTDWFYIYNLINPYAKKSGIVTSMNHIINKPEGLTRYALSKINLTDYYITEKTDGIRCLAVLNDKSFYATAVDRIEIPYVTDNVTVLDCELYDGKIYVFDMMRYGTDHVVFDPFHIRWEKLSKINLPDNFILKNMVKISSPSLVHEFYESVRDKDIDGLIFTPANRNNLTVIKKKLPMSYYDDNIYKWKPPSMLTIDLYIMEPPKTTLEPFDKPCLVACCGASKRIIKKFKLNEYYVDNRDYRPIPFQSPLNEYAFIINREDNKDYIGKVCEFKVENGELIFVRVRDDKTEDARKGLYFGNDYMTSDITYFSSMNPIRISDFDAPISEYFHKEKPVEYKAITKHNNICKMQFMSNYITKGNIVIDMASGLGQDINKYNKLFISTLICVDNSMNGLEELNNRKYSLKNPMRLLIRHIDLRKKYTDILKALNLRIMKADVVVINLAIHYIIDSLDALDNLMKVISEVLKEGGYFLFTTFDGERVDAYINANHDSKKFNIQRLYYSYDNIGKISVKHHFGESYEENLLDGAWLKREIKKRGFKLEEQIYFEDKRGVLSDEDALYSSLYTGYAFKKA